MQFVRLIVSSAMVAALVSRFVVAETHTVVFVNDCGSGTPTLVQNGNILSTGENFTINGPLISAVAYLQTGSCGLNGEGCTVVETTLVNPTSPGPEYSTCISISPPYMFSVTTGFGYFNGCEGEGFDCTSPDCTNGPGNCQSPISLPIACQADNVDLAITFCD